MSTPAVSVLMPAYDAQRYIAEAIESILAQSFGDFEFLIIDDGSRDATRAIAQRYASTDRRIRVLSRPNGGVSVATNDGLAAATAPLVARMDADDIALPGRLEAQVRFMAEHPGCVAVGGQGLFIDPQGLPIAPFNVPERHGDIEAAFLGGRGGSIIHPAATLRLDAMRRVGGYRPDLRAAVDLDLFLRLGEIGELANLPEVVLHYRLHLASITGSRRDQQQATARRILGEARARRGLPPADTAPEAGSTPSTAVDERRRWVQWACAAGNHATARKHAWRNLCAAPLSRPAWSDLALALRCR